jgi:hypothetical protein
MIDFAIKSLTLAIVAIVCFFVITEDNEGTDSRRGAKVHFASYGGDLEVVTIEAEKPAAVSKSKPEAILPELGVLPLESYKPSVKADDTKDKLAALDERVTQLESKFKTFATAKAGSGSTGGGSVGGGSTGSAIGPKVVYQSQPVTYYAPQAVVKPRSPVFKRPATGTCTVDKYGRVICR